MLKKIDIYFLYSLVGVVYICGLFIPLMENDSAQHATMAMRMFVENDFLNLYKGHQDYLDKPHIHFWLAALSFKIFGLYDWAYRIPAVVFTMMGAYYVNKLAVYYYGNKTKHLAGFIFLSIQAVILSNHDVRTDAVLTGATILALYHFVKYLSNGSIKNIILGFFGLAIGFGTKGQLAVFVCGVVLLVHVIYAKKWHSVFSYKVLLGLMAYIIFISPILYAYYLQFDLHPEKVFEGKNNISGVKFILWDQNLNRLNATGRKVTSPDYFFFFHTLLWAFLPWVFLMYCSLFKNVKRIFMKEKKPKELMSSLGVLLVLLVISTSKFKLPHYLNSLFPLMSVLVSGYLIELFCNKKNKLLGRWAVFQRGLVVCLSIFVVLFSFWAFPIKNNFTVFGTIIISIGLVFFLIQRGKEPIRKIIFSGVGFMMLINFVMNTQFYPNLLRYQSGISASEIIIKNKVSAENLFIQEKQYCWSLSFYTHQVLKVMSIDDVAKKLKLGQYLYLNKKGYKKLVKNGVQFSEVHDLDHYRVTRLKYRFLNPKTRGESLSKRYLVKK